MSPRTGSRAAVTSSRKNATYLDVSSQASTGGPTSPPSLRRIERIGDGQQLPDYPSLDATGKYVLPGLIDCHVHATAVTADLSALQEWSPGSGRAAFTLTSGHRRSQFVACPGRRSRTRIGP